jgi:hypothetical protein
MVQIPELLSRLNSAKVEYVIVGGVAASLHGSPLHTKDLDVCCPMTAANMTRLLAALDGLKSVIRGDPRRLPLTHDATDLARWNTILLRTTLGDFDVLREISGVGAHPDVARDAVIMDVHGMPAAVMCLDALIAAKRAAGRDKDKHGLMYLEAVKKRRESSGNA